MSAARDASERMLVTLTASEFRTLVREEVAAELARTSTDHDLLTPQQVAERLGVLPRSVATMVRRDGMPARSLGPKLLRFSWPEIEAWARQHGRNLLPEGESTGHRRRLRAVKR